MKSTTYRLKLDHRYFIIFVFYKKAFWISSIILECPVDNEVGWHQKTDVLERRRVRVVRRDHRPTFS